MKDKFIDYYMKMAELTSQLSYAKRLQVGAVIVKNHQVIGTGYNGMPSNWDNNCEYEDYMPFEVSAWLDLHEIWHQWPHEVDGRRYQLKTKPEVLHAESNAIAKVSRSTESSDGSVLFCTHAPCIECAKLIYQSGINSIFYKNHYRDDSGLKFLEKSGVSVTHYSKL